jgi:hypothetical protein
MPSANVSATELLVRGLRTEFVDTYARAIKGAESFLSKIMDLNIPSNKLSEVYGYFETVPHWKRWQRGEEIPRAGMKAKNFTVINYDWGISIDWHENDENDDQSMSLVRRVREAAFDAALLPERVFFQVLTGATDNNLLPVIPNAPDGQALFYGGANSRFGAVGGNALSLSGVTSTALIQQDFFSGYAQFRKFQDTEGQPLWPADTQNRGLIVLYNAANEQVFRQAFTQMFNQGAAAAPSNVIMDSSMKIQLWPTPRITNNSWYMFMTGVEQKAVFQQVRQAPRDYMEDMLNSDFARRTKIKSMQWDARYGYGVSLPYQCLSLS